MVSGLAEVCQLRTPVTKRETGKLPHSFPRRTTQKVLEVCVDLNKNVQARNRGTPAKIPVRQHEAVQKPSGDAFYSFQGCWSSTPKRSSKRKLPGEDFWKGVQDFIVTTKGVVEVDRPDKVQRGEQPNVAKAAKKDTKCLENCVVLNSAFRLRKMAILKKMR